MDRTDKIGIIGLGYVGFPLAVEFSKIYNTVGYDIDSRRVSEIREGIDRTCEISSKNIKQAKNLLVTNEAVNLVSLDYYIITVPTPIDSNNNPDLQYLRDASELVGSYISKGNTVVFECTVFPGCTEEVCMPIIEHSFCIFCILNRFCIC